MIKQKEKQLFYAQAAPDQRPLNNKHALHLINNGLKQMTESSFLFETGCIFLAEHELMPFESEHYILPDIVVSSSVTWNNFNPSNLYSVYGADFDGPWICGMGPPGIENEEQIQFVEIPESDGLCSAEMLFRSLLKSEINLSVFDEEKYLIRLLSENSRYHVQIDRVTLRIETISWVIESSNGEPTCSRWEILYPKNKRYANSVGQFKQKLYSSKSFAGKKLSEWQKK